MFVSTYSEVSRMREEDGPRALNPLVPLDGPVGSISFKVWDNVAQAQDLSHKSTVGGPYCSS